MFHRIWTAERVADVDIDQMKALRQQRQINLGPMVEEFGSPIPRKLPGGNGFGNYYQARSFVYLEIKAFVTAMMLRTSFPGMAEIRRRPDRRSLIA